MPRALCCFYYSYHFEFGLLLFWPQINRQLAKILDISVHSIARFIMNEFPQEIERKVLDRLNDCFEFAVGEPDFLF